MGGGCRGQSEGRARGFPKIKICGMLFYSGMNERLRAEKNSESPNQRIFRHYVEALKLTDDDLKKRILDVGSRTGSFGMEAARQGYPNAVSLDFDHPGFHSHAENFIVGDARALPIRDNEFDIAISIHAIPIMLDDRTMRAQVVKAALEMLRVVKPGGEVRWGHVDYNPEGKPEFMNNRGEMIALGLEDLRKRGIEITVEKDPTSSGPDRWGIDTVLVRIRKPVPTLNSK